MSKLNMLDARRTALFASGLQRSDAPTADAIDRAVRLAVRQYGVRGCAARMAQEFGDHPEAAAMRMRWIRRLTVGTQARPGPKPAGCDRHAA